MDRRKHPRLIGPFYGHWTLAAGPDTPCRVGDISLGGCFIHSQTTPRAGQQVTVTVDQGDGMPVSLSGQVVYEEWSDGFALKFGSMNATQLGALKELMGRLRSIRRTA
ncbi:MAG TPA: PilZ domain-containing protein [Vicinamibacterales bacterium]|nr:PilZ domain-containing protein [Vicinamibacterales bacterium]